MYGPGPGGDVLTLLFDGVDLAESLTHAQVVDEYAVVEVDFKVTRGQRVEDVVLIGFALGDGLVQLLGFTFVLRAVGAFQLIGLIRDLCGEVAQILQHRMRGGRRIAMQIDQSLERALVVGSTRILPVDRTVLVHGHMVLVEIVDEILAQRLAKRPFDIRQILRQMLRTECDLQEPTEPGDDVILEAVNLGDRYHIILVRLETCIRYTFMEIIHGLALGGENESRLIDGVTSEHAANRIGDELLDHIPCE